MYINKQTTVKAGFNPNSIKSFINVKTTFQNIFHNLTYIDFIIYCFQMSIQIGNLSKQGKNLYKPTNNNHGLINIDFKNIIRNINTKLVKVFPYIKYIKD